MCLHITTTTHQHYKTKFLFALEPTIAMIKALNLVGRPKSCIIKFYCDPWNKAPAIKVTIFFIWKIGWSFSHSHEISLSWQTAIVNIILNCTKIYSLFSRLVILHIYLILTRLKFLISLKEPKLPVKSPSLFLVVCNLLF